MTYKFVDQSLTIDSIWKKHFEEKERITLQEMIGFFQGESIKLSKEHAILLSRYLFETDTPLSEPNIASESEVIFSILKTLTKISYTLKDFNRIREELCELVQPKV